MANICFNTVLFRGNDDQIEKLQELFLAMQAQAILTDEGQLPDFIDPPAGYFFDMTMDGKILQYTTKWVPNLEVMRVIADHFGLGFSCHYDETANCIYGQAVYEDGVLQTIYLDIADFARYDYDEEREVYVFEGGRYPDECQILEILLERRKNLAG